MAGVIVVGIGLLLLLGQTVPDVGSWIPLVLGLVFLAAFLVRREYGFLVPGSILTGIGVGVVLVNVTDDSVSGAVFLLSLAGGFLGIWALGTLFRVRENHWWPFIPGGILALLGTITLAGEDVEDVLRWWPLILVAGGALIIGRAIVGGRR